MLALVLLAIPPILTNTYVGVRQVDREVIDAGKGMGLKPHQVVRRIELPLALPSIFGGIRTSAVNVVATATIAPLAGRADARRLHPERQRVRGRRPARRRDAGRGAGALGRARASPRIQRAVDAAGLAGLDVADRLLPAVKPLSPQQRRHPDETRSPRPCPARGTCRARVRGRAGGVRRRRQQSSDSSVRRAARRSSATRTTPARRITVGSKNFTEQFILGEIYAQALQAAGYTVKKDLNLGSEQIALKALKSGDVDGYPEYTSTALTSFFDVQPQDIPKDAAGGGLAGAGRVRARRASSPMRPRRSRARTRSAS